MPEKPKRQQSSAAAGKDGLTLEDSLSYGRRNGFITYEGEDFLVSGTPIFWMIDFTRAPSRERRQLLESKGFENEGGLWMLRRDAMSTDAVKTLALTLEESTTYEEDGSSTGPGAIPDAAT